MTKSYRQRAEESFSTYLDALEQALGSDDVKASVLTEARKFFESQGIDLSADGSVPSKSQAKAEFMQGKLRELKGNTGTDG